MDYLYLRICCGSYLRADLKRYNWDIGLVVVVVDVITPIFNVIVNPHEDGSDE